MTYSLCHPSRGRPAKAYSTFLNWIDKASMEDSYQYILSLDVDDPDLNTYRKQFKGSGVEITVNPNRSMVDASNRAGQLANGEVLILVSDDFDCPADWNELLRDKFAAINGPALLHINDAINNDGTLQTNVVTLTIMNRELYDHLGYMYHPDYFSMFVDNDLTETAKTLGAYYPAFDLTFAHNHWLNGKAPMDKTYKRENSQTAWTNGKKLFESRFPQLKTA
jgi:hypothetical protein